MSLSTIILDALFPPLCVHCGREGAWLCLAARNELALQAPLIDPLCIRGVDHVVVRGSYDCPTLAQLIQKLKYHYWTGVSPIIADIFRPVLPDLAAAPDSVIVPVPLHRRRRRERGFNQALLISRAIEHVTGLLVSEVLQRSRYTTPQAQLSAKVRTTNIIGAFHRSQVAQWPRSVILVDDVITTGSTIAECAAVLRQHGVQEITAVAIAKG